MINEIEHRSWVNIDSHQLDNKGLNVVLLFASSYSMLLSEISSVGCLGNDRVNKLRENLMEDIMRRLFFFCDYRRRIIEQ